MFARKINHDPWRLHPGATKCHRCYSQAVDGVHCEYHGGKEYQPETTGIEQRFRAEVERRTALRRQQVAAERFFMGIEIEHGARLY